MQVAGWPAGRSIIMPVVLPSLDSLYIRIALQACMPAAA